MTYVAVGVDTVRSASPIRSRVVTSRPSSDVVLVRL
jgi:hypothetical protein